MKRLEVLDVSNNQISTLYSNVFNLRNLGVLILRNNKIKKLPKQVENLKNLNNLNISGNQLTELPKEFGNLENLEELNIANNNFKAFPSCLLNLSNLKTLWLGNNNLEDFPTQDIINLKKLKSIYCFGIAKNSLDNLNKDYLVLTGKKGNSIRFVKELNVKPAREKDILTNMEEIKPIQKINKNKIFISYSHQDEKWRQRVEVFLKALQNEKKMLNEEVSLDFWSDKRIKAGQEWEREIEKALDEAYIAILIISAEFLASEYIITKELPPILENAESHGTKIISLIAGPCRFKQNKLISKFQAVNEPSAPLSNATPYEQDVVFLNLSNVIADYIF